MCVHIELCSDFSSETFIAASRRFSAHRCRCNDIYCDSRTNFISASHFFKSIEKFICKRLYYIFISIVRNLLNREVQIKVLKSHLYRVISGQILTYKELNTLLIQIEAVMNSYTLCSNNSDAHNLTSLTPDHFCTLKPLNSSPGQDYTDKVIYLSRR